MKSSLQLIPTSSMSHDDWLAYRRTGLGASDISTLMGLNPYKSSIELFYEKIGIKSVYNMENIAMFMGKEQEAFVADLWQYWAGSEESMIANYRAGKIVRKCQRVNYYVRNPKFPALYVSLDRKINKHEGKEEGSLEIKTISGYESEKWVSGIPPAHIIQLQTQLMVCEFDYGELATLTDGRRFQVYPFEKLKSIFKTIAESVADFWLRVEKARILVNQMYEAKANYNQKLADQCQAEIDSLEPAPDSSDAYLGFMKEKYKTKRGERKGTETEYLLALQVQKMSEKVKSYSDKKKMAENTLRASIKDMQIISFGDKGKIYFSSDGKKIYNAVKIK